MSISRQPDLEAVAETLSIAFAEDPVVQWAIPPDTANRARYLNAFFILTTQMIVDQGGFVASSPGYDAVVTWLSPRRSGLPDCANRAFLDRLQEATGRCGLRLRTLMKRLDQCHPKDLPPHVYVVHMGIRPQARGSGLQESSARGLRDVLKACEAGCYAEASSTRSLRLWERLGIKRYGDEITLPDGGPSLYPLYIDAEHI
ncbi:GNAT family N-acetyltransferase [Mycobacterium sp. 852002-40037_SCH5390672]|uniref:GNAT family N-acetyltransferase n=1 Tax=Mycobacterium sp. 852002-40037_SCH5390672 TaxID=1834089 RepID=UPI0012E7B348|nr:GNAT family N-acetyltransferase [Mycobacterium sp. 852002-40037_SCH5390672]